MSSARARGHRPDAREDRERVLTLRRRLKGKRCITRIYYNKSDYRGDAARRSWSRSVSASSGMLHSLSIPAPHRRRLTRRTLDVARRPRQAAGAGGVVEARRWAVHVKSPSSTIRRAATSNTRTRPAARRRVGSGGGGGGGGGARTPPRRRRGSLSGGRGCASTSFARRRRWIRRRRAASGRAAGSGGGAQQKEAEVVGARFAGVELRRFATRSARSLVGTSDTPRGSSCASVVGRGRRRTRSCAAGSTTVFIDRFYQPPSRDAGAHARRVRQGPRCSVVASPAWPDRAPTLLCASSARADLRVTESSAAVLPRVLERAGAAARYSPGRARPTAPTARQPAAASQPGKVSSGCFTHASTGVDEGVRRDGGGRKRR